MGTRLSARGAAAISGGALLVAYLATLAPTVTLWDSGEFLAAIHSLGIPHPPGTPLFVFAARAWTLLTGAIPFALSVNLASAVCSASAAALFAWLMGRWTGRAAAGLAGALVGGATAAAWQSATEAEVYAYATLVVALALVAAEHAGTRWSVRHRLLVAFLFGLAVPLHLSVLVAGPAVILLASSDRSGAVSFRAALAPVAAWCVAVGMGTVRPLPVVVGLLLAGVACIAPDGQEAREARRGAVGALVLVLLGASFVVVMLVRARHDPAINEGNPATWQPLVDLVARRQYDVAPLWPRRAPVWLQLGNVVQYADWQVASSLSDAPGPSPLRTPLTLLFVALGTVGAVWHRRRDRRSWNVVALLLACATVGVVVVLNLRAGPSFGHGILPDGALREARERDYFFSLAFLVAGLWCGCGIVALCDRLPRPWGRASLALALLPLALNWHAVDRRRLPDATLARDLAVALLAPLPPRAVLVVAGDNDSFPLWYLQQGEGVRRDVTTVTIPLLGASWYRDELERRHNLLPAELSERWRGLAPTLAAIGRGAERQGRPLRVAVSVTADDRRALVPGRGWRLLGMSYATGASRDDSVPAIDTAAVLAALRATPPASMREGGGERSRTLARDATGRYVQRLLECPKGALARSRGGDSAAPGLLESTCNYR